MFINSVCVRLPLASLKNPRPADNREKSNIKYLCQSTELALNGSVPHKIATFLLQVAAESFWEPCCDSISSVTLQLDLNRTAKPQPYWETQA